MGRPAKIKNISELIMSEFYLLWLVIPFQVHRLAGQETALSGSELLALWPSEVVKNQNQMTKQEIIPG